MSEHMISRRSFIGTTGAAIGGSMLAGPLSSRAFAAQRVRSDFVRAENSRPGTADWILTKVFRREDEPRDGGWHVRKAVQGYASHLSIRAGETLDVYVSTDPSDEYILDIFRMGYYGGRGGRLMASFGPVRGTPQPMPADGANNIIECRWDEGVSFEIPEDWLSGFYLGKLAALTSEAEAYIIFVVRDDRPADLMLQCSDFTWISYNRWPKWRSLYDAPSTPWGPGREDSYDAGFSRPYGIFWNGIPAAFEPLTNGSGEFLMTEFPLVFWLEKQGYDVTYISNLDAHEDGAGLLRGKVYISVGHDEYWTQELYDNVIRARDAGVSLAFLSGNAVSGRIELLSDSNGRPHRGMTLVDRFGDASAELMGSRTYGVGFADWTCAAPDHWAFEGTGMEKGDSIGQLVGWEFHGYPLGSHSDLVVLAEGPIRNAVGVETDRRYASTIYTAQKGNYVFNAATCWWNKVLSVPPAYIHPPNTNFPETRRDDVGDERVRLITKNVLDRMLARGESASE